MNLDQEKALILGFYQRIFADLTQPAGGAPAVMDSNKEFLQLCLPAIPVRKADFVDPYSPVTGSGNEQAMVNLVALLDAVSPFSPRYKNGGARGTDFYRQIMDGANLPATPPNPTVEQQRAKALAVLWADPVKLVKTDQFQSYLTATKALQNAVLKFNTIRRQTDPSDWPSIGPMVQDEVNEARTEVDGLAPPIRDAQAQLAFTAQNQLAQAFLNAKERFENSRLLLGKLRVETWPVTVLPTNWADPASDAGWTTVEFGSADYSSTYEESQDAWSVGASIDAGLWSAGVDAGGHDVRRSSNDETQNVRIQFEYALCSVFHDAFDLSVLEAPGWSMGNLYKKGELSAGPGGDQSHSRWPLLATAFLAVKDVDISADWGSTAQSYIESALSVGGEGGFGPVTISGEYSQSEEHDRFTAQFVDGHLIVDNVQILGVVNRVMPVMPAT